MGMETILHSSNLSDEDKNQVIDYTRQQYIDGVKISIQVLQPSIEQIERLLSTADLTKEDLLEND